MRLRNPILMIALCFFLATAAAVSLRAQAAPSGAEQPGGAYQNGYDHGQADAQQKLPSNNQPTDQWTTDEARSAYRKGYDAGYSAAPSNTGKSTSDTSGSAAPAGSQTAAGDAADRYGYQDGLAAGRKDHDAGHSFRPTEDDMYKSADHGWTADFGDRDHYRQLYRQGYTRGYQEGYGSPPPR
jgi:hypothetical protein